MKQLGAVGRTGPSYPDAVAINHDQLKHDLAEATTGPAAAALEHGRRSAQRLRLVADRTTRIEGVGKLRLVMQLDRNKVAVWRIEKYAAEEQQAAE